MHRPDQEEHGFGLPGHLVSRYLPRYYIVSRYIRTRHVGTYLADGGTAENLSLPSHQGRSSRVYILISLGLSAEI